MVLELVARNREFSYEFEYGMLREDYMYAGNIPSLVSLFGIRPWGNTKPWKIHNMPWC